MYFWCGVEQASMQKNFAEYNEKSNISIINIKRRKKKQMRKAIHRPRQWMTGQMWICNWIRLQQKQILNLVFRNWIRTAFHQILSSWQKQNQKTKKKWFNKRNGNDSLRLFRISMHMPGLWLEVCGIRKCVVAWLLFLHFHDMKPNDRINWVNVTFRCSTWSSHSVLFFFYLFHFQGKKSVNLNPELNKSKF